MSVNCLVSELNSCIGDFVSIKKVMVKVIMRSLGPQFCLVMLNPDYLTTSFKQDPK